jgi:hypothetical protein
MIGNITILLIVIGLTVLFAWLTYRAVRANTLWVKIAGGLGAGLLTLVVATVAFFGGKGVAAIYFPEAPPASDLGVFIVMSMIVIPLSAAPPLPALPTAQLIVDIVDHILVVGLPLGILISRSAAMKK